MPFRVYVTRNKKQKKTGSVLDECLSRNRNSPFAPSLCVLAADAISPSSLLLPSASFLRLLSATEAVKQNDAHNSYKILHKAMSYKHSY